MMDVLSRRRRRTWRRPGCVLASEGDGLTIELDAYDRPLRPLSVAKHVGRYRPVDDFDWQLKKFTDLFSSPAALREKGYILVVVGEKGYGKTSMRQRCAYWMSHDYKYKSNCDVVVVDISDEEWKLDASRTRLMRTRDRILEELEVNNRLKYEVIERIGSIQDGMDSYRSISRELTKEAASRGRAADVLVVLLPGYLEPQEIEEYYSVAREGMVFIAEMYSPKDIADITAKVAQRREGFRRDTIDAHILQLGVLKAGDEEFLMRWIESDLKNGPKLMNDPVVANINGLLKGYSIGARELILLLMGVLKLAMEDNAKVVTLDHIARYYQQMSHGS